MRKSILRILVALMCFMLGMVAFFGCYFYQYYSHSNHQNLKDVSLSKIDAYREGRSLAEADLSEGKLKVKTYGLGVAWQGPDLYKERLWNDYGVELDRVAGCMVTEELTESVRGYNEVSITEIERRYGKGILGKVREQAGAEWKERQKSR